MFFSALSEIYSFARLFERLRIFCVARKGLLQYRISYSEVFRIIRYIREEQPDSSSKKSWHVSYFAMKKYPQGPELIYRNCENAVTVASYTYSGKQFVWYL